MQTDSVAPWWRITANTKIIWREGKQLPKRNQRLKSLARARQKWENSPLKKHAKA